jgi:DtxR family transcriptional regulator, Mn-dependent transcriptional regulator
MTEENPTSTPLTPTREDYLRAVYELARAGGEVRLTDLARVQGVRLPTAHHAVDCLRDAGYLQQESYGLITLTDLGREAAVQLARRFELIRAFLVEVLGVSSEIAERDAHQMEHHLDEDTLNRIASFVTKISGPQEDK